MKIFFCCFVLLASLPLLRINAQEKNNHQHSNQRSPDFEFITLAGDRISSADLKGKIIVLDFWSADCTPCRKSMPQMEEFYQKYKNNQKVAIYLVNSGWEPIEKARDFANNKRSSFLFFSWGTTYDLPFAYDQGSKTLTAFGLESNPSTIIIDSKSRIRLKHSGFIKDIHNFLSQHVDQYLAEN
jgi:thiol-disulfide isomerase/thioredoxin